MGGRRPGDDGSYATWTVLGMLPIPLEKSSGFSSGLAERTTRLRHRRLVTRSAAFDECRSLTCGFAGRGPRICALIHARRVGQLSPSVRTVRTASLQQRRRSSEPGE